MSEEKKQGFVVRDRRFWAEPNEEDGVAPTEPTTQAAGSGPSAAGTVTPGAPAAAALDVERLRSALAELEDAKHRVRRDAERQAELLKSNVLESLIPVLDNLQRSLAAVESSRNVDALIAGIRLVEGQFLRALGEFGLSRVSAVGARFDPRLHDAVAVVPVTDPAQDGVVVAEIEPAYFFGERVIRPAKVQVGRAADRPTV